jgi:hypothetical protein
VAKKKKPLPLLLPLLKLLQLHPPLPLLLRLPPLLLQMRLPLLRLHLLPSKSLKKRSSNFSACFGNQKKPLNAAFFVEKHPVGPVFRRTLGSAQVV